MDGLEQLLILAAAVIFSIIRGIYNRLQERQQGGQAPDEGGGYHELPHDEIDEPEPVWTPAPVEAADGERLDEDPWADERRQLAQRLDGIADEAAALIERIRRDRASDKLIPHLESSVIARARAGAGAVRAGAGPTPVHLDMLAAELELILGQFEMFVAQRQRPGLRGRLGDADALAMACYQPVIDFARVNNVPLSSAVPVTLLTPFDLSIWTGFAPTGVAPLFLPPDFFHGLVWWPALAHEIGHDFLVATRGADERLRQQLGLPPEEIGTFPLRATPDGLTMHELYRVFGGWFEELFCDVFATLMLGASYGRTAVTLFAAPDAPERVTTVHLDRTGTRYGVHPPRHLRVHTIAHVLELIGEHDEAERMRATWDERHGHPDAIRFPVPGGIVTIPLEPVLDISTSIATTLYREPLDGFDGHSLSDIPGVDHGPGRAGQTDRARRMLASGQVPRGIDARSVIAAAVLVWLDDHGNEAQLMRLARIAIVGEAEWVDGAPRADRTAMASSGNELREAFILHTLLAPPKALAHRGRRGLLVRR